MRPRKEYNVMWDSFQRNRKGIMLMLVSSVCVCIGQLLWKLSSEYGIIIMFMGFGFYGVGAFVMLFAYRYGKLSVLQPMLSLNYVLSIILAALILREEITALKCVGIIIIIAGVIFIAGGEE